MDIKGSTDFYSRIIEYAERNNFEVEEYGEELIGEHLMILKHREKDITISYLMDGYSGMHGATYECVYSDIIDRKQIRTCFNCRR